MLIELGNAKRANAIDGAHAVTQLHFPEADETGQGGYTLKKGMKAADLRAHMAEAREFNNGIYHLPDHEILLSIVDGWPSQVADDARGAAQTRPTWVKATAHELTPSHHVKEVERFISEYYECPIGKPEDVEHTHWTRWGAPGHLPPIADPVDLKALFLDDGRTQQGTNNGGGQVGVTGAGTAATATTFTTNATLVTNAWAGYRIYAYSTSGTQIVWGNILSNTNAAGASVVTVDRWYSAATPGGTAGTTPTTPFGFILADGGNVSAWFVGLSATNSPAHGDHSLSGEIVTAGGGLVRKISPYALTSGVSPMTYTLTPVFTANGSDALPVTVAAAGAFNSMVVAATTLTMKFETGLSATATFATSGDNATLTWTVTGS